MLHDLLNTSHSVEAAVATIELHLQLQARQKIAMANGLKGALIGGGLGMGAGALRSLFQSPDEQRHGGMLSNALQGGLLGAGLGGAAGFGYDQYRNLAKSAPAAMPGSADAQAVDAAKARQVAMEAEIPKSDPMMELIKKIKGPSGHDSLADAAIHEGKKLSAVPATAAVTSGIGYGLGSLADRQRSANRVFGLDDSQLKMLPPSVVDNAKALQAAKAMPGASVRQAGPSVHRSAAPSPSTTATAGAPTGPLASPSPAAPAAPVAPVAPPAPAGPMFDADPVFGSSGEHVPTAGPGPVSQPLPNEPPAAKLSTADRLVQMLAKLQQSNATSRNQGSLDVGWNKRLQVTPPTGEPVSMSPELHRQMRSKFPSRMGRGIGTVLGALSAPAIARMFGGDEPPPSTVPSEPPTTLLPPSSLPPGF